MCAALLLNLRQAQPAPAFSQKARKTIFRFHLFFFLSDFNKKTPIPRVESLKMSVIDIQKRIYYGCYRTKSFLIKRNVTCASIPTKSRDGKNQNNVKTKPFTIISIPLLSLIVNTFFALNNKQNNKEQ